MREKHRLEPAVNFKKLTTGQWKTCDLDELHVV